MSRLACALLIACCLPPAAARASAGARADARPLNPQQQDARPRPTPTPARRDEAEKGDEAEQLKRLDAERPAALARENAGKTEDQLVAEALAESIRGALRKPKVGETRARGALVKIDCAPKGLVFHVNAERRVLRLHAESFDKLHIMAFTSEAGGEITCGERKPQSQVVVTYRAKADAKTKTDGSLAAVEFVPTDFQLKTTAAATAARPARQR